MLARKFVASLFLALVTLQPVSASTLQAPAKSTTDPAELIAKLKQADTAQAALAELRSLDTAVLAPLLLQALAPDGALAQTNASEIARSEAYGLLGAVREKQVDGTLVIVDALVVRRLELGLADPSALVREVCARGLVYIAPPFRESAANALASSLAQIVDSQEVVGGCGLLVTVADALRDLGTSTPRAQEVLSQLFADPSGVHATYWERFRTWSDPDLVDQYSVFGDFEVCVREHAALAYLRLSRSVDGVVEQKFRSLDERGQRAAVRAVAQVAAEQLPYSPQRDRYGPMLHQRTAEWLSARAAHFADDERTLSVAASALCSLAQRDDVAFEPLSTPFAALAKSADADIAKHAQRVLECGRITGRLKR